MAFVDKVVINTDGGARGNPGPAGAGAILKDGKGKILKKISKYLGKRTNNWAEYEAVALALEALKKIAGSKDRRKSLRVEVHMDSELVVRQLNSEYQIKEPSLFSQYIRVHNLRVSEFPNIKFTHIPRVENKEADRLANEAMEKGGLSYT